MHPYRDRKPEERAEPEPACWCPICQSMSHTAATSMLACAVLVIAVILIVWTW